MNNKFLSYFQSGSKPESSNFDGTIQNLYTSDFGGLTPVFCKPVLANDHFKISLNSEVKVSTLSAPAYSNIKQNFYAFFVANQAIWKHHNSFITNGTEFQDVYGSNNSNQELNGIWKVPSIRINDLQFITKIAKGFALPIITLQPENFFDSNINNERQNFEKFFKVIPFNADYTDSGIEASTLHIFQLYIKTDYTVVSSLYSSIDEALLINLMQVVFPDFRRLLQFVPYVHFHDLQLITNVSDGIAVSFSAIDFGLSLDDIPNFISACCGTADIWTPTDNDNLNFVAARNIQHFNFRFFCDEHSRELDINNAPFTYDSVMLDTKMLGHINLNASRARRKYTENAVYTDFVSSAKELGFSKIVSSKFVRLSPIWSKELTICESLIFDNPFIYLHRDNMYSIAIPTTSEFGIAFQELFESEDFYPSYDYEHESILCGVSNDAGFVFGNWNTPVDDNLSNYDATYIDNVQVVSTDNKNVAAARERWHFPCDFAFPFYCSNAEYLNQPYNNYLVSGYLRYTQSLNIQEQYLFYTPLIDTNAVANGMTTYTFMLYLCNSVCKTLDYCNIPYEGFTIRDFDSYCMEHISALPFMAISSIWQEFFRNRTVSAPELCFKEVNGSAIWSVPVHNYCVVNSHNYSGSYYDLSNFKPNSWVIPFDVTPKNGLQNIKIDGLSVDSQLYVQGLNEFHYYNITSQADLFSLLTGFQLNHSVLQQVIQPYTRLTEVDLTILYGAILERFQLPQYYNGLLHYKYQNFGKDYFSSALLDAMSGANQENIPQTVTELRTSEAKQSFWEQTAVARSVSKFFDMLFGTKPSHIEYNKPILLGQSHNNVSIGEIIQTSGTAETPQGTRTGIAGSHSVAGICNHGFNEQGWLIILTSFSLDSQYFQGLSRQLVPYESFLDYPFRQFYHIGNQSINMREVSFTSNPKRPYNRTNVGNLSAGSRYIFNDLGFNPYSSTSVALNPYTVQGVNSHSLVPNACVDSDTQFDSVFGFIPRFSEYKFNQDELHGDFRSTLMPWNTFRKFHTMPFLTHQFVNWELSGYTYDLNRLFAVKDNSDKFICSLYVNVEMHRPIPYYTVPKSSVN